ncbi:hypothetical protein [Rhodopila sp.]|uniref:hypothetical protein n=1 Tax=Rhodopila sp. TaxID=2480087 RepID=UPI002B67F60B|nr:hypothetical protein [Rhodopila sp.]HVZ09731.1 hypothetical protein [Rhodopila sp.]
MASSTSRVSTRRRTREEVIELFRACAAKLDRTPGEAEFDKMCGIPRKDVRHHFWKGGYSELAEAAGLQPNTLTQRFEDAEVFEDYAKVCVHIGRVPSETQLRGATRELRTKTSTVYSRFVGGIRSANLVTASALMRLVEDSIRDWSKFSLGDFERQLFAHKVIET